MPRSTEEWAAARKALAEACLAALTDPAKETKALGRELFNAPSAYEFGKILGEKAPQILVNQAFKKFEKFRAVGSSRVIFKMQKSAEIEPTHKITMSRNKFQKFKEQIQCEGIKDPIKYVEHNGTKYVVDGHHRLRAARELGIEQIPAEQVNLPFKGYRKIEDLFTH